MNTIALYIPPDMRLTSLNGSAGYPLAPFVNAATPVHVSADTRINVPGLTQLSYRVGTYTTVLQRLASYLTTHHDPVTNLPVVLDTGDSRSWAVALLESWAMVIDVLTFYQERIANEGYLNTATELYSVMQLVRSIGYELRPGAGASTYLAFSVREGTDQPSRRCLIPQGVAVQSVPTQTRQTIAIPYATKAPDPVQLPQTFETSADFEARSEWNAIKPVQAVQAHVSSIATSATSLRLAGIQKNLHVGDPILIVGDGARDPAIFRFAKTVEPHVKKGFTQVTWENDGANGNEQNTTLQNPAVFALRKQAKLFNYTQSGLYYTTLDKADWSPSGIGLPNTTIHTLISHKKTGDLFVGTDNGVFRSSNNSETWDATSSGLMKMKITALAATDDGTLYAGSSSGSVFSSEDNGNNWRKLTSKIARRTGLLALLPLPKPKDTSLPKTVIRALTTYTENNITYLIAATDDGVFWSRDGGNNWERPPSGASSKATTDRGSALAFASHKEAEIPLVGMSTGVFPAEVKGSTWRTLAIDGSILVSILAVVLFIVGVLSDPDKPVFEGWLTGLFGNNWLVNLVTSYGLFYKEHFGSLLAIFLIDAFLIAVFLLVGQRPLVKIGTSTISTMIRNWHTGRNIAIFIVLLATVPIVPAALNDAGGAEGVLGCQLQGEPLSFDLCTFHPFLSTPVVIFFAVAVIFAIFLLIWWLIDRSQAIGLLPGLPIRALAFSPNGNLLASTEQGTYRSQDSAHQNWELISHEPLTLLFTVPLGEHLRIEDLNASTIPQGLRDAFTSHQIELGQDASLALVDAAQRWTLKDTTNSVTYMLTRDANIGTIDVYCVSADIRAFETSLPPSIFAGTEDGKVFRTQDNGNTWQDFSENLHLSNVRVLLITAGGLFAGGLPDSTGVDGQWTRFQVKAKQLDLDKSYIDILPSSWAVLRSAPTDASIALSASQVTTVTTGPGKDFKKSKDVTSIVVKSSEQLTTFDRRTATLYTKSEPLPLYNDEPISGDVITFDRFVPGLEIGHHLLVSGKRVRIRLSEQAIGEFKLASNDGLQYASFTKDDTLQLIAPPGPSCDGPASSGNWKLRDRNGFTGSVPASAATFRYEAANDDDEEVSELALVASADLTVVEDILQGSKTTVTRITLSSALQNVYDRSSVTIRANVVFATQGQTMDGEVLGSVNQRAQSRRFMLKQKPLIYLPSTEVDNGVSDMPGANDDGMRSTLSVQVNSVPWHQVRSFHDLSSSERAYMVRHDSASNTTLIFGDGKHGARLPSGSEHITATYRFGNGEAGNVSANSLTVLRTRPPGIKDVTNPLPASGGAGIESIDQVRLNATRHVQTLGRIVSLKDYEHFARTFPGIGKVQGVAIWNGRTHGLLLTIAGEDGKDVPADSALYTRLFHAISTIVASPAQPLYIRSFDPLYFSVGATLIVAPEYAYPAQKKAIIDNVTQELTNVFSFSMRDFGQDLSASEVITIMQHTPGIIAVMLENMYITDTKSNYQSPTFSSSLPAKSGRIENGELQPAQLLVLNTINEQGISLKAVTEDEWMKTQNGAKPGVEGLNGGVGPHNGHLTVAREVNI